MQRWVKSSVLGILAAILLAPPAAWAFYKQSRILAPSWNGVTCRDRLCLDDTTRFAEARALYDRAFAAVEDSVDLIAERPLAVFCGSTECFESFGLIHPTAHTFSTLGMVMGPRGWKVHYVRHEMIHHLQAERLGFLGIFLSPVWFREGMAYSLSGDPRRPLKEPWEGHRARFEAWYPQDKGRDLWERARGL